jgi:hypothetical protein
MAGMTRMAGRWDGVLLAAGFEELSTLAYEVEVSYTHHAWRGRMRACNGVIALGPDRVSEYDEALARVLRERFPEPIVVQHEVFALTARARSPP